MKRLSQYLLCILSVNQRTPIKIEHLAAKANLCEKCIRVHLHYLEHSKMIRIDRSERPYAYELTELGWITTHSSKNG
jgi:predicted transcriptional regulator